MEENLANKFHLTDLHKLMQKNLLNTILIFFSQLNRILEKRNLYLAVKTTNDYEITNNIFINHEKINLYPKQDLKSEKFWKTAPKNFFRKINEILKSNNSDEKFYLLYGGNDLSALLLTEKQFQIIREYYKN